MYEIKIISDKKALRPSLIGGVFSFLGLHKIVVTQG